MSTSAASGPSPEGMARAAEAAVAQVTSGMALGLGTGRSAEAFIRALGARIAEGLEVTAVATSLRSEKLARELNISLRPLDEMVARGLELAVDGADEITDDLALTKGLGGALLRERVVASLAERFVILVTPNKRVVQLGSRAPIPIEIVAFAEPVVTKGLIALGAKPELRRTDDGKVYRTDNGNPILDATVSPLDDPRAFDAAVRAIPGVVDTGLFLDMASEAYVGLDDGTAEHLVP